MMNLLLMDTPMTRYHYSIPLPRQEKDWSNMTTTEWTMRKKLLNEKEIRMP